MLAPIYLLICLELIQGKALEQLYENDTRPLCPCGKNVHSIHTRVVGGHAVGRNRFPYATGLLYTPFEERNTPTLPFCGGTLFTDRHIITAAHCLRYKTPDSIAVDVGDYSLRDEREGRIIPVRNLTMYPSYRPDSFHTDIGIIELERPVSFHMGIYPAPLPSPDLELKEGTTVIVYGWGRLRYEGGHPDKLNGVELPVVDNKKCQPKFISKIEPNMICAGGEKGKDACIGDSGSGLVVQLNNQYVLCGIVSFGRRCALPGVPGVYTRVSSYVDWILENTKSSGCKPCVYEQKE